MNSFTTRDPTYSQGDKGGLCSSMSTILTIGPIRFDTRSREVVTPDKTAHLTIVESRLLRFLMEHANRVCTHQEMSMHAWGMSDDRNTRFLLKAAIGHLRQKIESDPTHPVSLLTASAGKGYLFQVVQEPMTQLPGNGS